MLIRKYALRILDYQKIYFPTDAKILRVAEQDGELYLWALINPNVSPVTISIRIIGTGRPFDDFEEYPDFLGTVVMHGGALVWHVFAGGVR